VAVAGRSNVGKSSLLNWLWQRKLARVAKAPGKTRTLNFFEVNGSFFLVDLPGYGYAKVDKSLRAQWDAAVGAYLSGEDRLAAVLCLVDIRHGPTALDLELQELLLASERERLVVLTKADKVGRSHQRAMQTHVQRQLALPRPPVAVSVQTGTGRREVLAALESAIDEWKRRRRGD
jgi:GTP-binding protein